MTGKPGDALSFIPGLAQARPHSHSQDDSSSRIDRRIERITTIGAYLEREALEKWLADIR
jgi:hypothetical protein